MSFYKFNLIKKIYQLLHFILNFLSFVNKFKIKKNRNE